MHRDVCTIDRARIAVDIPRFSEEDWRALVLRSTGQSIGALTSRTDDGINVGPIYGHRTDATPIYRPREGERWRIVQRVDGKDAASTLSATSAEIAGGADGIVLTFADSIHPLAGTVRITAAHSLATELSAILPTNAAVFLDAGPKTAAVVPAFLKVAARHGYSLNLLGDPITAVATGHLKANDPAGLSSELVGLCNRFEADGINGAIMTADGRVWHAAGASEVQELAAVLATFIAVLRQLTEHEVPLARAAKRVGVAVAADSDQFLTIAKLRALRLLLRRALDAAEVDANVPVHAETAWRMMSRREPRMNVLRATGAAFAAAVGGADTISVLPFDAIDGASAAAGRLARNTQIVIAEEAQVFRFSDPAAGSGAVEALTDALAERAWERFRAIEAAGGMIAALKTGSFQQEVAATRDARIARVDAGETEMVGVNVFKAAEAEPAKSAPPAAPTSPGNVLVFRRLAEMAEASA